MFKLGVPAVLAATFLSTTVAANADDMHPADNPEFRAEICEVGREALTAQVGDPGEGLEVLTQRDVNVLQNAGKILVNMYCPNKL